MTRIKFPLAILCLAALSALAQNPGALSGKVLDLPGDPVPNVPVQITNTATKAQFKGISSAKGEYTISSLPAGTYDVSVTQIGFNPFSQPGVSIPAGQTAHLDIHLYDYQLNTLGDGVEIRVGLLTEHQVPKGPTPRTAEGHPDLSGMWHPLRVTDPGKTEMLPWAAALFKERTEQNTKDSPFSQCLPRGVALMGGLYPWKIVQMPKLIVFLFEDWVPTHREIFMDGRAHPKDLYTWTGHATARWEGDTLVVDRAGFNYTSWIDTSVLPHTEKLHVVERFRRPDLGHLEVAMTFDDPGTFVHPLVIKGVYDNAGDDELQEFICNENNKDVTHMVGK